MYRCEVCGSVTDPGIPANRIVVETRAIAYPHREKVHWHPPKAGGSGKWVDDKGGTGTAIVREVVACPSCVTQHEPRATEKPPPTSATEKPPPELAA